MEGTGCPTSPSRSLGVMKQQCRGSHVGKSFHPSAVPLEAVTDAASTEAGEAQRQGMEGRCRGGRVGPSVGRGSVK